MDASRFRDEIIACGRDPAYFMRKYVRIRHPVRGTIPFSPFPYQDQLVRDYSSYRFNVVLKARQLGISEVTAIYAAWLMLFHRDKVVLVAATKTEIAKNMIRKIKSAIQKLPNWLRIAKVNVDNMMSIELSNGSIAKAVSSSSDSGRSEALSLLIVDEAAFIRTMDELWTGLLPTVQAGGRVIMLSTPNGVGNIFHKIYTEAEAGLNEFHPTKIMWWEHPEHVENLRDDPERPGFKRSDWFDKETRNMPARDIAQELEANFNSSGDTVITGENISWIESSTLLQPIEHGGEDGKLFVWAHPQKGRRYFVSADVARGDGRDNSTLHVFDVDNVEQVAEYCGKMPVNKFAELLCDVGKTYGNCLLVVENNSVGLAALEHVIGRGYPNLYYSKKGESNGASVNTEFGSRDEHLVAGFTTTSKTRSLAISKLEEHIRMRSATFRSARLTAELRTFVWFNGRPEAMRGYNDDLVMAAAIGLYVRDTFLCSTFSGVEHQRQMLKAISKVEIKNTDIRGASKNPEHVPSQTLGSFYQDSSNPRVQRGKFLRVGMHQIPMDDLLK